MYTCMHSAHAYTHTLALLAGVQGGTYTHTGLAGLDVRGNIHTHRPCWPGCKGEHTHTQAGVQGGTYTHTGFAGRGARENIHTHRPGCKGEQGNIRKTTRTGVKVYSISKNVGM